MKWSKIKKEYFEKLDWKNPKQMILLLVIFLIVIYLIKIIVAILIPILFIGMITYLLFWISQRKK